MHKSPDLEEIATEIGTHHQLLGLFHEGWPHCSTKSAVFLPGLKSWLEGGNARAFPDERKISRSWADVQLATSTTSPLRSKRSGRVAEPRLAGSAGSGAGDRARPEQVF